MVLKQSKQIKTEKLLFSVAKRRNSYVQRSWKLMNNMNGYVHGSFGITCTQTPKNMWRHAWIVK